MHRGEARRHRRSQTRDHGQGDQSDEADREAADNREQNHQDVGSIARWGVGVPADQRLIERTLRAAYGRSLDGQARKQVTTGSAGERVEFGRRNDLPRRGATDRGLDRHLVAPPPEDRLGLDRRPGLHPQDAPGLAARVDRPGVNFPDRLGGRGLFGGRHGLSVSELAGSWNSPATRSADLLRAAWLRWSLRTSPPSLLPIPSLA